jgi:hypothetical protein
MSRLEASLNRLLAVWAERNSGWNIATPLTGLSEKSVLEISFSLPADPKKLLEFIGLYDFNCCQLFCFLIHIRRESMRLESLQDGRRFLTNCDNQ